MRTVDQALYPHHCAVFPQIGNSNSRGFFDTGSQLGGERVYVSFVAVCEMARELGWIGPTAVRAKDEEIASLQARIEQLESDNAQQEEWLGAIDALESAGLRARKKSGRKQKEKVT